MLPAMSRLQRQGFLAEVHVAVLGVPDFRSATSGPLLTPVWYAYEPGGEVTVQTGRQTLKAQLIRAARHFSLCVQDERPPYRYVSVEGPLIGEQDPLPAALREAMVRRYLPAQEALAYLEATESQLDEDTLFRMRPERWRSADFSAFAAQFS